MPRKQAWIAKPSFIYGILGLGFLNLLLFGDVLFNGNGRILSSSRTDLYLHFAAWRQFGFDQLRQGHLVLWNPHYLCGSPFLGNFESALLYPLNWFYLILPLAPAINWGIALHVFLAGLFTLLWTRHRGLHPLSCFLAGVGFMFGGAFYLHLFAGHLPNLCAMVWAPLLFLSLDGLVEGVSLGWVLLGMFAVSMQLLAGHPQYVYFTAIGAGIYILLNLIGHPKKLSLLANCMVVYAGGFLLTAVQLWTGIQAFLECSRNIPLEFNKASSFSFPPQNILTLILPEFFGNLTTVHYWSQWFLWEVSLFIGVGAFFLAAMAIVEGRVEKRKWALTMTVIIFIFSLGAFTPLYRFFYDCVPFFKGLRGICKFDFLVGLFLAMLCGIGMDVLIKNKKISRGSALTLGIVGLLFFGAEVGILDSLDKGSGGSWGEWFLSIGWLKNALNVMDPLGKEEFLREAGLHSALSLWIGGFTCLLLYALVFLKKPSSAVIYAVAGLVVVELFVFARFNRPTFELADLQKKMDRIQKIYQNDPGDYRVYGTGSASLVTGGFDLWEDEPMVLGRYGRFVCYSQGLKENQLFSVLPIFSRFNRIFSMVRLKYLVTMDEDPRLSFTMPFAPLPRMLLLNQYEIFSDGPKILPALFDRDFDPSRQVCLESQPEPAPDPGKPEGKVAWKDLSTDQVEISVETAKASLLFITDNYSRGWRVRSLPDSSQARYQVMPGNYFLRVIPLSAGRHHFILEYRPLAFILGKWVSIFSSLIYVGMVIFYFKRNVRRL